MVDPHNRKPTVCVTLVWLLHCLGPNRDSLISDNQEISDFTKRCVRGQIRQHITIPAEFVTNSFGCLTRFINRENCTARTFHQLIDYLLRFGYVTANSAARTVLRLDRVDSDVLSLQLSQNFFERRLAATIEPVADDDDDAFLPGRRL